MMAEVHPVRRTLLGEIADGLDSRFSWEVRVKRNGVRTLAVRGSTITPADLAGVARRMGIRITRAKRSRIRSRVSGYGITKDGVRFRCTLTRH